MQVVSASRRTDIPAFYADWFVRRLEAGFCHVLNPFNASVQRVSLLPEDCIGIVCWTRHPAPLAPALPRLTAAGHSFAFHYTLNGYPPNLESHNPPLDTALRNFKALSDLLGPERVWWRYDPILLTPQTPPAWHLRHFARMARELAGYTARCTFSFVHFYKKTRRNLVAAGAEAAEPELPVRRNLAAALGSEALAHGIRLESCCDDRLVEPPVGKARCVDAAAFRTGLSGLPPVPPAPTRADCGCCRSVDVGAYDTCLFGCAYCYATNSRQAAQGRHAAHRPEDTLLWRPATLEGRDLETSANPFPLLNGCR